jgi:hypothetical protein
VAVSGATPQVLDVVSDRRADDFQAQEQILKTTKRLANKTSLNDLAVSPQSSFWKFFLSPLWHTLPKGEG